MASAQAVKPPSDITLTLTLSAKEAEVLKSMVQNEWAPGEGPIMGNIRQVIWDALTKVNVAST